MIEVKFTISNTEWGEQIDGYWEKENEDFNDYGLLCGTIYGDNTCRCRFIGTIESNPNHHIKGILYAKINREKGEIIGITGLSELEGDDKKTNFETTTIKKVCKIEYETSITLQ
jgi:hypothetical protein